MNPYEQLKIDRNIPIPPDARKNNNLKQTVIDMNIGDSICGFNLKLTNIARIIPDRKYTQRKEGDKIRIWRVA